MGRQGRGAVSAATLHPVGSLPGEGGPDAPLLEQGQPLSSVCSEGTVEGLLAAIL